MKILMMITRGDSIGGAQIHVKDIAQRLNEDGHEVLILLGIEGVFSRLLKKMNIEYIAIDSLIREIHLLSDIKALKKIVKEIKVYKPDLIALHSSKVGILGRIAAKITNIPVVFTAHGWAFTDGVSSKKLFLYKYIEKVGTYISDKVITVSEYDKQLAIKYNVGKDKIVAIHNGMNEISEHLLSTPIAAVPNIIMVARFQEPKDHISLIRALNELKDLKWNLKFVGEDGGLEMAAKKLVLDCELDQHIQFLGNRSDIDKLLSKSQIFVLTSFWEGFPLTIIEGMRAGLPVIASNVGGVSEAIVNGKTGYVINSFEELVSSLKELIQSAEKRKMMGEEGKNRYHANFTFDIMYNKTLKVYQEIISKD